ncbi:hypothetical protein HY643_03585 [Candidatus Woesearchaeota archaeon]|nr:hypothetical protein [Candidatus Woesearchaeota archaeon]
MELKLKTLNKTKDFEELKPYVKKGALNIVVHPFYSTYFELENQKQDAIKNSIEERIKNCLLANDNETKIENYILALQTIKEYTNIKAILDRKELTILLLPRKYTKNKRVYEYIGLTKSPEKIVKNINVEDYLVTLSQITQNQPNFLIAESKNWDTGEISKKEIKKLRRLIDKTNISAITLSGGFIDGCLDNAAESLDRKFRDKSIFVISDEAVLSHEMINHYCQRSISRNAINSIISVIPQNFFGILTEALQHSQHIMDYEKFLNQMQDLNKKILSFLKLQCESISYPSVRVVETRQCL